MARSKVEEGIDWASRSKLCLKVLTALFRQETAKDSAGGPPKVKPPLILT